MVSICIPVYEMNGEGVNHLKKLLDSLNYQSNKEFEVIISDDSLDNEIEIFISKSNFKYSIKYFRNISLKKNASNNLNSAIINSSYSIIKPMFQDDWVINNDLIKEIINSNYSWGVFKTQDIKNGVIANTITPKYNKYLIWGINTIGSPSVIYFKKDDNLLFDEKLINLMDVDFYYRLYKKHKDPMLHKEISINTRIWNGSVSNTMVNKKLLLKEENYIRLKYNLKYNLYDMIFIRYKLNYLNNILAYILNIYFKITK